MNTEQQSYNLYQPQSDVEQRMSSEGIIFSTEVPNALFVKEGLEGGPYVCYAFAKPSTILLQFTDMTRSESRPFTLGSKAVDNVEIDYRINDVDRDQNKDACQNNEKKNTGDAQTASYVTVLYQDGQSEPFTRLSSEKYRGLALDVQAKLYFADILRFYLQEKNPKS